MNKTKKSRNPYLLFLFWTPPLIIMYIIFQFSAADSVHSSALSDGITAFWISFFNRMLSLGLSVQTQADYAILLHTFVRKCGHFLEYTALGFSLFPAIFHTFPCVSSKKHLLYPWIIATCYAASDEFHQLFVPGRAGMFRDILLDSLGAAFGIFCVCMIHTIFHHHKVASHE